MSFYHSVAAYYDYIFQVQEAQVQFLEDNLGHPPKRLLDIACGTGSYALALSKKGYRVTALDADESMIEKAREKAQLQEEEVELIQGYMQDIKTCVQGTFDGAYCIGNSLVHLSTKEEISAFFKEIYERLNKDATFIIQIINYDRVIKHAITQLPPVENKTIGLEFTRNYGIDEDQKQVSFNTRLKVKDKVEEHTTMLLPLFKDELEQLLQRAGFNCIKCYGDFKQNPFVGDESYHCIMVAKKS